MSSTKTIKDYMSPFPHSIGPDHSMAAAHRLMRRHNIRHLPVMDQGKLQGVVSQRDLYFIETLTDSSPDAIPVSEAMSEEVLAVAPDAQLDEVAALMVEKRAGSAVILEEDKVIGIFTTMDALRALA